MNFNTFEPRSTSTPKKMNSTMIIPNACSTPRPAHVRLSLAKCAPFPIDASTPNTKKSRKSFAPDIHRLIYPSNSTTNAMKMWVL